MEILQPAGKSHDRIIKECEDVAVHIAAIRDSRVDGAKTAEEVARSLEAIAGRLRELSKPIIKLDAPKG